MFELLIISDIINKHKDKPAIIECHGPSANDNRLKINKFKEEKDLIIIGCNEWWAFEDHPKPDYWVRCSVGANGEI